MPAPAALLTRAHYDARPSLPVTGPLELTLARAHEICGAARRTLALVIAAVRPGPVLWIAPDWLPERLNGPGLCEWIDPGRITFVHAAREADLLWTLEEALRAGIVPCVVGELPHTPGLTAVRRLHLAAEQGSTKSAHPRQAPLGLLLSPHDGAAGGAPGIESRWALHPAHTSDPARDPAHTPAAPDLPDAPGWRLERLRARSAPPATWPAAPTLRDGRQSLSITT
ncbi:hypothetical protein IV417_15220 [Alphaproteobacteria bacterium KMM 3653]|uniref:Protein ImuA n=1 Tax=Harenicola maris TaxID=2841044 RepID=A0AAP2G9T9_9RHOB|nr:hypothetical protein [Harenicola maris]